MWKNPKIFFLILLIFAGFFCFNNVALAVEPLTVVINEIAWMGTATSTADEWIELYNNSDSEIDLTGWTLKAIDGTPTINLSGVISTKGYFLTERTDDNTISDIIADWFGSFSSGLNNNGEKLELIDAENKSIDVVDCTSAWFAGNNITKATMERIDPKLSGSDPTNWANNNLIIKNGKNANGDPISGTPKTQNSVYQVTPSPSPTPTPPPPAEPPTSQSGSNATPSVFSPSDLVINEIVSDPLKGQTEWLEIYKNLDSEIDLSDWTIEEGSGSVTSLSGKISKSDKFYVVENLRGKLNNEGDIIILKWNGKIIDKISYGDWNDGELKNNAEAPESPNSLARITDSRDTDNDLADFAVTQKVTKGSANQITAAEEEEIIFNYSDYSNYSGQIIINEILPNPVGDDETGEFIELRNLSTSPIDLVGWQIADASSRRFTISKKDFSETILPAQGYFLIERKISKIALNNNGDEVKLYQPNGQLLDSIAYKQSCADSVAYARDENQVWQWTTTPSAGKENKITLLALPPEVVISALNQTEVGQEVVFDGSDSSDSQSSALSYLWNFGDGATCVDKIAKHKFTAAGKYQVKLAVTNQEKLSATDSWEIEIKDSPGSLAKTTTSNPILLINEILPDPEGSDEGEFIEIYNPGNFDINLKDWSIDDEDGGSRPYKIKTDLIIKAGLFAVIKKQESGLALNNDGDQVRLFNPENKLIDEISYEPAPAGASFALASSGNWFWTDKITPGKINEIDEKNLVEVSQNYLADAFEVPLSEIDNLEVGEAVITQGIVSVAPGILGKQIFYLSGSGIQVYMFKKDFPEMKEGDLVKVSGTISEAAGERRIKIKNKEDIVVLSHAEAPIPEESAIAQVDEERVGDLITISGDLTQKTSSGFYLDDGEEEIYVYLKSGTGIDKKELAEGDKLKVTGIVSLTKSGLRLLPRYQSDIVKLGQVLGESTEAKINDVPTNSNSSNLIKYLIAAIGALVLIITGLGYKLFQIKKVNDSR
ncbi:MAG: lamin tail domain-containing protein [bacterium]